MPKTRQLRHGFFLNEDLARKSPHARLLFQGLWLLCDREGRLEDRPAKIKAQILPYEDVRVSELLDSLAVGNDPFIVRYEANGENYIAILKFTKHQHIHADEKKSELPEPPVNPRKSQEIPGEPLKKRLIECSSEMYTSVPTPSSSPTSKQPQTPSAVDPGRVKITLGSKYVKMPVTDIPFDEAVFLLGNTPRLSKKYRTALEWRVSLKATEKTAQAIPGLAEARSFR